MNRHISSPSDEISLVDLVVLLVKRWKLMLAVFLTIALGAIAVALMQPATYSYTSLYAIAELQDAEGQTMPLEAPSALLARLRLQIQPNEVRGFLQEHQWNNLPFDLAFSQPQGTDLIALTSNAPEVLQANVDREPA